MAANTVLTEAEATAALETYGTIAGVMVDSEIETPPDGLKDWCTALMICHLLASADPDASLTSYTSGDYSQKSTVGVTTWWLQLRSILDGISVAVPKFDGSEEATRSDSDMDLVGLDQSDDPMFPEEGMTW